jgi:threonine efflux protein
MMVLQIDYQSELLTFSVGYLVILMTPGPNLLVIAMTAAERGLRGSFLLCAGITAGAGATGACLLGVASLLQSLGAWWVIGQMVAGVILIRAAARLLFGEAEASRARASTAILFLAGLMISSTNPITFAYFSAAALSPLAGSQGGILAATVSIIVLTFLRSVGVAALAGSACVKRTVGNHAGRLRMSSAVLLAMLGGMMIWPGLSLVLHVL